jgi:predicted phosphodiesterase
MIIDIYSDLHVDSWRFSLSFSPPEINEESLCIVAGDIGNGLDHTERVRKQLTDIYDEVFIIPGNHDYYQHTLDDCKAEELQELNFHGIKIVGCTYWTDFRKNVWAANEAYKFINDFVMIKGMMPADMIRLHYEFKRKFLALDYKPDIIVTHFPPVIESEHAKYAGNPLNPYFINDDQLFFEKMSPKYWIHGHTHSEFDYVKGETRVICNPMGYRKENFNDAVAVPVRINL